MAGSFTSAVPDYGYPKHLRGAWTRCCRPLGTHKWGEKTPEVSEDIPEGSIDINNPPKGTIVIEVPPNGIMAVDSPEGEDPPEGEDFPEGEDTPDEDDDTPEVPAAADTPEGPAVDTPEGSVVDALEGFYLIYTPEGSITADSGSDDDDDDDGPSDSDNGADMVMIPSLGDEEDEEEEDEYKKIDIPQILVHYDVIRAHASAAMEFGMERLLEQVGYAWEKQT